MGTRKGRKQIQALFAFAQEEVVERRRGVDELFAAVGTYRRGRSFICLLERMVRFRAYSPANALLVALQRPRARCVLSAARWRGYNREVKAGAAPIVLLRSFSPVAFAFDVTDTRVRKGYADRLPPAFVAPEKVPERPVAEATVETLLARLPWWGIRYETVPTGPAAVGELHLADAGEAEMEVVRRGAQSVKARPVYVLTTRALATATERFTALVQALAHLFCHHLRCDYGRGWKDGRTLTAEAEALEADLVVWLVCRRLQVASPLEAATRRTLESAGLAKGASLEIVLDAVAELERMLGSCTVRDGYLARLVPAFAAALQKMENP